MTLFNIVSGEGSVLWEWNSPSGRKSPECGVGTSPGQFWAELGVLGAGGVEWNSRGGDVVLTHTCSDGLCVIPLVLERDREELQFSKRSGAALMEIPKHGELRMCHTSLAHGCVGSLLVLGCPELSLGCAGLVFALILSLAGSRS